MVSMRGWTNIVRLTRLKRLQTRSSFSYPHSSRKLATWRKRYAQLRTSSKRTERVAAIPLKRPNDRACLCWTISSQGQPNLTGRSRSRRVRSDRPKDNPLLASHRRKQENLVGSSYAARDLSCSIDQDVDICGDRKPG